MKIPKESPLAVSYSLPEISFLKREAKIYADESGYLFVQYSGEVQIQERFDPEALTELLKLIPVIEYIYDEKGKKKHKKYDISEIDPHKVISYLNRFGVVGISDLESRKIVDPKFLDRLSAIRKGDEVPYHLIKRILQDLAKSARLYINLLNDPTFAEGGVLSLTDKNRKRIVSAWHRYGGAFKDSEDPASPKFNLNEEWTYTYGGKRKIPVLDFAEGALSDFSQVINKHLSLITKSVVTTEGVRRFNRENSGLETAFSAFLVNALRDMKIKRVCRECGSVFLPERVKDENKYCGKVCRRKVVNRNYKAKKKVSASKAGSKATSKARKEKK